MKDSGVAIMGSAIASGEKRALKAVESALNSPLLNDNDISGARHVLLNIMSGSDDIDMDEFGEITDFIQEASGGTAELITGYGTDASLGDSVSVTIIATGFKTGHHSDFEETILRERKVVDLNEEKTEVAVSSSEIEAVNPAKSDEPFMFIKEEKTEAENKDISFENREITETKIEISQIDNSVSNSITESTTTEFTFTMVNSDENQETVNSYKNEEIHSVTETNSDVVSREEQIKLAQERIRKLKEITLKMKSPDGLAALEKETAFTRKNINLENKNYSQESNVSRFTLSEGEDKKTEIRPNNSFLHDNVD
jgi:cell division protein FtsZ